jgi:THO complex subunit 7
LPSGFALTAITTAMAAYYAISPLEDDAVIRQTTGGDPLLKKLITKFIAFPTEMEKDGNNFNDSEKLYKSFLQDLATFELPLLKTMAMINANKSELESFTNLSSGT